MYKYIAAPPDTRFMLTSITYTHKHTYVPKTSSAWHQRSVPGHLQTRHANFSVVLNTLQRI